MLQTKDGVILRTRKSWAFLCAMFLGILPMLVVLMTVVLTPGWVITPLHWVLILLFGILAVLFIAQMLPNSSYLLLKEDGFTLCSLYRKWGLNWSDIEEFRVGVLAETDVVAFNFSSTYNRRQKVRKITKSMNGFEMALTDTYGMSAEELARLMNNWKAGIRQKP
jgi:hypothetical protein